MKKKVLSRLCPKVKATISLGIMAAAKGGPSRLDMKGWANITTIDPPLRSRKAPRW